MPKRTYEIDGRDFAALSEFFAVISRVLIPGVNWGHNLDAFDDVLLGGFGTPEEGFILHWLNSETSKKRLGRDFDVLVEILRSHGPGGEASESGVELVLL